MCGSVECLSGCEQTGKTYKSGEVPLYGDVVKGRPNGSDKIVGGVVSGACSGSICIIFLANDGLDVDEWGPRNVYGEAENFELLHRNEKGGA